MKKLGIYGGTFNPVHMGHIRAAEAFYDAVGLDELLIMPTFISPHKAMEKGDDPAYRLEMTALAFEGNRRNIAVSDYEINKGGKSYTYLTLEHFSSPDTELYFLMGTDMLLSLDRWREPQKIFDLAVIALVRRENDEETGRAIGVTVERYKREYGAKIVTVSVPPTELSSSEIREAVARGESTEEMVPDAVREYIKAYRLYTLDPVYAAVRELVPKRRLRHIFGTVSEAEILSEIYGLDAEDRERLRIAAALHDVTKYYSAEEHLSYLESRGVTVDEHTKLSEKTLHQLSGAYMAEELFPETVDARIFGAIRYHTTAKADMSILEKLMYLADYIEAGRTFPDCVTLRGYFYGRIDKGEDRASVLTDTLILSLEMTVNDLNKNGLPIHSDTVSALEFLKGEKKMEENKTLSPLEIAEEAVKVLDMKKGANIKLLHVTEKTVLADYFIICGGNSTTQVKGLSDEVEYKLGLKGITPAHVEGHDSASWVLLDYHSVIVHVFTPDAREFYNLEKHWAEAEEVDISHLLTED